MPEFLREVPGRLFLAATLLPLLAFAVLLVAGTARRRFAPNARPSPIPGYFASLVLAAPFARALWCGFQPPRDAAAARVP